MQAIWRKKDLRLCTVEFTKKGHLKSIRAGIWKMCEEQEESNQTGKDGKAANIRKSLNGKNVN